MHRAVLEVEGPGWAAGVLDRGLTDSKGLSQILIPLACDLMASVYAQSVSKVLDLPFRVS